MENGPPGLITIKDLPHGFYEKQILEFFSQFGDVEYVRVKRSRKSGLSCGIAYVKFGVDDVAEIAADSMNQYSMFGHTLRCVVKSKEWIEERPKLFAKNHSAKWIRAHQGYGFKEEKDKRLRQRKRKAIKQATSAKYEDYIKRCQAMVKADKKLSEKLKGAGIEYDYPLLEISKEMEEDWKKEFAET